MNQSTAMYVAKTYDLRWKLNYVDGSSRFGMWSKPAMPNDPSNMASLQPRNGLVSAAIEGKHLADRSTRILCQCDAQDYDKHKWIAALPAPTGGGFGSITVAGAIQGMTLEMRHERIHVTADGKIKREPQGGQV